MIGVHCSTPANDLSKTIRSGLLLSHVEASRSSLALAGS